MREIKFRGQRCNDGKWVYGSYVESNKSWAGHKPHKSWILPSPMTNGGWFSIRGAYAVKEETVGQFTGLYDKNGKEIYEGDVIDLYFPEDGKPTRCTVKWNSEKARFEYIFTNKWHFLLPQDAYEVEVVGNIHDKQISTMIEQTTTTKISKTDMEKEKRLEHTLVSVYKINNCQYVVANSIEEAIKLYKNAYE